MYSDPQTLRLDFNALLDLAGYDPSRTLVVRHVPVEKKLKRALPWIVAERPDLWLAYQRIQWESLENAMQRGTYIASFVGLEAASATLAGFYEIGDTQSLDYESYQSFPGNAELEKLGMSRREPDMEDCLAFALNPLPFHDEWTGKLTLDWPPPFQQWWRWGGRKALPVSFIARDSRFVEALPDWRDIVLEHAELATLPATWSAALSQWRGVYFIHDRERQAGYVGAAYGSDNILGRWQEYAQSGHGGNRNLRASDPAGLTFSILERTSPDMPADEVIALEASWKARLHTRSAGLNAN